MEDKFLHDVFFVVQYLSTAENIHNDVCVFLYIRLKELPMSLMNVWTTKVVQTLGLG